MSSLPYPAFFQSVPIDVDNGRAALPAVGRCRVFPESCIRSSDEFRAIVAKNTQQALVDDEVDDKELRDSNKKLKKKYMKEGVAMAKQFLSHRLRLDVSIIDVEVFVESKDLIETNGCLAVCLLDAGCHAIVTDGSNIQAMDVAKVPRERLVAHFVSPFSRALISDVDDAIEVISNAAALASTVSVELSADVGVSVDNIARIVHFHPEKQKEHNFHMVAQVKAEDCGETADAVARTVGSVLRSCKDGRGSLYLVDPSPEQLGRSFADCIKTDRSDGLFTTVVCTRSGEALGLVYSSQVSEKNLFMRML
jgi:hypothetical protein